MWLIASNILGRMSVKFYNELNNWNIVFNLYSESNMKSKDLWLQNRENEINDFNEEFKQLKKKYNEEYLNQELLKFNIWLEDDIKKFNEQFN